MKRSYLHPEISISVFESENVVTLSGGTKAYDAMTSGDAPIVQNEKNITVVQEALKF